MRKKTVILAIVCMGFLAATAALSAYHHMGEEDSGYFIATYPDKAGTKLDHCATCHTGGSYVNSKGQTVSMGSCQWCHDTYGYDGSGNINDTLNAYGAAYSNAGHNQAAVTAIEALDSDGDGYTNIAEIQASRFPGDPDDDPTKQPAPSRVYTRAQLEEMTGHTQFMLMNTSRSGDFYAEYSGVPMETLLEHAGALDSAVGITVFAPDGWATYHPMAPDNSDPSLYHISGDYPQAAYHYHEQADTSLNSVSGWCDYSAPSCWLRVPYSPIVVPGGLKAILAFKREGDYLNTGVLNADNKLDGEGPFRVVVPQKTATPPDQSSKSDEQGVVWPYDYDWDHNAGFCSRSATIIRVEPLPEGTTDINVLEAGWNYVDEGKILVYGALDVTTPSNPVPADDSPHVSLDSTLSWTGCTPAEGVTVAYDVHFGTTMDPPLVAGAITQSSYDPGLLQDQTVYYWKVVARYSDTGEASSPLWQFTAAKAGVIQGTITTFVTGQTTGIAGASITIVGSGQAASTNAQGSFTFADVEEGVYTVKVEKQHFYSILVPNVTVTDRQVTDMGTTSLYPAASEGALLGDVNGDDRLGIADAIFILKVLSGSPS